MNVLILGGGGREHALAWKIAQSHHCDKLYIAPGNPGIASIGATIDIGVHDFEAIKSFCLDNKNYRMSTSHWYEVYPGRPRQLIVCLNRGH